MIPGNKVTGWKQIKEEENFFFSLGQSHVVVVNWLIQLNALAVTC